MRRRKPIKQTGIARITSTVLVEDGNFNKAFRDFRRKTKKSRLKQECRERSQYIKPSERRKLAKAKAIKMERKRAGLL